MTTLSGTASDNWQVTGVWYQLNGSDWTLAPTTNNWTNWSQSLPLIMGTNMIKAYAQNMGGNYSPTSSLSFYSSNTFHLQLAFTNASPLLGNDRLFRRWSSNLTGHIQYSTNMVTWVNLTNFNGTNTTLHFRDPAATNSPFRFYRATIP